MTNAGAKVLIDTGFFVALFLKNDEFHLKARDSALNLQWRSWLTTWPVITEVCYFLQKHAPQKVTLFLELIESNSITVFALNKLHIPKMNKLLRKYSDYEADLADISLVIAAEELEISDILSTDFRDFAIYRWHGKPFRNLL